MIQCLGRRKICSHIGRLPFSFTILILNLKGRWNSGSASVIIPIDLHFTCSYGSIPIILYIMNWILFFVYAPISPAFGCLTTGCLWLPICLNSVQILPTCSIIRTDNCTQRHICKIFCSAISKLHFRSFRAAIQCLRISGQH